MTPRSQLETASLNARENLWKVAKNTFESAMLMTPLSLTFCTWEHLREFQTIFKNTLAYDWGVLMSSNNDTVPLLSFVINLFLLFCVILFIIYCIHILSLLLFIHYYSLRNLFSKSCSRCSIWNKIRHERKEIKKFWLRNVLHTVGSSWVKNLVIRSL